MKKTTPNESSVLSNIWCYLTITAPRERAHEERKERPDPINRDKYKTINKIILEWEIDDDKEKEKKRK